MGSEGARIAAAGSWGGGEQRRERRPLGGRCGELVGEEFLEEGVERSGLGRARQSGQDSCRAREHERVTLRSQTAGEEADIQDVVVRFLQAGVYR